MRSGPDRDITIDGASWRLPNLFDQHDVLAQALSQSAGRPSVDVRFFGENMPAVPDRWEWVFGYDVDDRNEPTLNADLERLRTKGGVRELADWIARIYTYYARSAQQYFFLPRPDAFSKQYANHTTAEYGAKVKRNGTALTVVYKTMVSVGDAVPSTEAWIGNTPIVDPLSGFTVAPFKVGATITLLDQIEVEYYPLYRAAVIQIPTKPFELVGRADKVMYLAEVK